MTDVDVTVQDVDCVVPIVSMYYHRELRCPKND